MRPDELSVPVGRPSRPEWGSDAMAEMLARLDLDYVALTPGASYRGLHDSLVNYLGNKGPRIVLCIHEEHAVAIAHGYAMAAGRPMAVALHSNVGLMHATMAIFNAWCARVPMVVLGATGPLDASSRRPWIDWIHTASDQGALIRNYSKWDDQPGSVAATLEALLRANLLTRTYPCAPTYVCIDSTLQEGPCPNDLTLPSTDRYQPVPSPGPSDDLVGEIGRHLAAAQRPLLLVGRVGRSEAAWADRVRLAEAYGAYVLSDLKVGALFPTGHAAQPLPPQGRLSEAAKALIARADLVLALDWVDLGGTIQQACRGATLGSQIISCSADFVLHNGWSKDHCALAPVDLAVATHPDLLVEALVSQTAGLPPRGSFWNGEPVTVGKALEVENESEITLSALARSLRRAIGDRRTCFAHLPLGWDPGDVTIEHPLDHLGGDGGGGVGHGPGAAVGAALALEGSGRLAVAVLGDGDFLMGSSALWTAAHYRLPLLVVVANNRSFYNDEVHQHRMAMLRSRPVENRWLGQQLRDPDPDLAGLARSYGLVGHGPVEKPAELDEVLLQALRDASNGKAVVVDVRVATAGYPGEAELADRGRARAGGETAQAKTRSRK